MNFNNYSKKVIENFLKPKNIGEIKNPDGVGKVGNPICGDILWIYIKIGKNKKNQEIIKDIKFKTFGCSTAIATASMVTQLAKKKQLKDAKKISEKDIFDSLGGLPSIKKHCSNLASKALKEAIKNWEESPRSKTILSP